MFTKESLTNQFKMFDKSNSGKLPMPTIVTVVQSLGMNTTGEKVTNWFKQNFHKADGDEITVDEFINWFKTTNPQMYKDA